MRLFQLSFIVMALLIAESAAHCQKFELLRDINGGIRYLMPGIQEIFESNGRAYFRVSQNFATGGYKEANVTGFWSTDGTDSGTILIKGMATFETMDDLVKVGSLFFFTVTNSADNTTQLWKSDGSIGGTQMLNSWNVDNASYQRRIHGLTSVGAQVYFIVETSTGQDELWKSDGTSQGTTVLGSFGSAGRLMASNGTLFFAGNDQLWKSDGHVSGTVMVKDVEVLTSSSESLSYISINNLLFFVAYDATHGEELWKTDGTENGTEMVLDIEPGIGNSLITDFAVLNGRTYFFAHSEASGALWSTDGTSSGTVIVKDLQDGYSHYSSQIVNVNGALFFAAYDSLHGTELWKSNGSADGTVLVKDINIGPYADYYSSRPHSLFNGNGTLYFAATSIPDSGSELWKSDGTAEGTAKVKAVNAGNGGGGPSRFVDVNGLVLFVAYTDLGDELWKTDGTSTGTVPVKDIVPSPGSFADKFVYVHGRVYFSALNNDTGPGFVYGRDLYQTDGTTAGTVSLALNPSQGGSQPLDMAGHNGIFYISAMRRDAGHELHSGTGSKPTRLKDIYPADPNVFGNPGSQPKNFRSAGRFLFFSAFEPANGEELWKTDGTEEGTVLVKNIHPVGDSKPENIQNVDSVIYFAADDGVNGKELWKSDGTEAGTVMIKDIYPLGESQPANLVTVNGILYFTANNGIDGVELWRSDGTGLGTFLVKNIRAGSNGSNPAYLTAVDDVLYFSADDGINGVELWKSDGTSAGTIMVKDIFPGGTGSNPSLFTDLNGIVVFSATNVTNGRELWKSDGTSVGTILVKDIFLGGTGSNPTVIVRVGNLVLFGANDGLHGNEVWLSNGEASGTKLMDEIQPGVTSSDPTAIFPFEHKILVAATGPTVGNELWTFDIPLAIAAITTDGPVTMCAGKTVTLKANSGAGYTYQWKKAGVNVPGANQSNYTATLGGYYSVFVTDAFGFSATSETVIVTVVNPPLATVAAAGPLSFCTSKNVLLKATTGTGYTYQWKKAGINIDNATSSNYTATTAGAYSVVVTNATGCSATSALLNVTVNPVPLATVAAASALTFCEGKTVQLKAITGTGYTYQWKRGAADIVGATSSNYSASATGFYTVIVTNANGCSATSAALAVVVKPLPAATITAAGPTTLCSGKNVLLKANTGTNYTYQWIRGAAPIAGGTQANYSATQPGLYTVIVTNASGCSVTSAAIAVSVNPLPVAAITASGPLTFCSGQNVLLRANTGTNYTYQWKKAGINITGATQANYQAIVSGAYNVVVTNAAGCAVTSSAVTVTVNNAPLASVAIAGPTTFCTGKSVLLKAITGAGYTYQWKKNNVSIVGETTSNYTATAAGNYSVVVSNASGCSTTSSLITVATTPAPLASVAVTGPLTFCEGGSVLLKGIVGTGYTYQWKKNGVNIPAQTQSNFTANATGVYTVLVTNVEGCTTLSSNINVTVTPAPAITVTANGPLTFPQGGSVTLNAPAAAGNTYQWKKGGLNITGATTSSYAATTTGSYTVAITNAGGCQAISLPAVVTVTQTRPITKGLQEDENITVYPNPLYRNNYLNIDWSIAGDNAIFVTVYDMSGKKINSQRLLAGDRTVNVTGASGVYLVECRWGVNKRKIFKVVKVE